MTYKKNDKYHIAGKCIPAGSLSILDVGCRDAIFKKYIPSSLSYSGVDLEAGENVDFVASLENGLPFEDASFDVVAALDVLEHVNNIWFACDELFRVSKSRVIAILPNAYYWPLRVGYTLGREMNKYKLTPNPIVDRHRWLVSHNSAVNFFEGRSSHNGWRIVEAIKIPGSRRFLLIDAILGIFSKNLTSYATLFVLEKDPQSL